jgi:hypothetical protein
MKSRSHWIPRQGVEQIIRHQKVMLKRFRAQKNYDAIDAVEPFIRDLNLLLLQQK